MKQKINIVFFSEDNLEMQNWTYFLRTSFQFAAKQINCMTWALCASWKWSTAIRQKYKKVHRKHILWQILNVWKEKVNIWYLQRSWNDIVCTSCVDSTSTQSPISGLTKPLQLPFYKTHLLFFIFVKKHFNIIWYFLFSTCVVAKSCFLKWR